MKPRLSAVWHGLVRLYRWYPVTPLLARKKRPALLARLELERLEDRLPPGDPTGLGVMALLGAHRADPLDASLHLLDSISEPHGGGRDPYGSVFSTTNEHAGAGAFLVASDRPMTIAPHVDSSSNLKPNTEILSGHQEQSIGFHTPLDGDDFSRLFDLDQSREVSRGSSLSGTVSDSDSSKGHQGSTGGAAVSDPVGGWTLTAGAPAPLAPADTGGGASAPPPSQAGNSADAKSVSANAHAARTGSHVTLTSNHPTVTAGQAVTFTVKITALHGSRTPTGAVSLSDGSSFLGTVTLNSHGQATFTITTLTAGSHSITARYGGSSLFTGSSAKLKETVKPGTSPSSGGHLTAMDGPGGGTGGTGGSDSGRSVITFSSSASTALAGQDVVFTAVVSPEVSGSGTPTGSVTFKDGPTNLGAETLNSSGTATLSITALSIGSHNITVSYSGDSKFSGSSAGLTETIDPSSSVLLSASVTAPTQWQPVTFSVAVGAVYPLTGTPTGSVTFVDNGTTLGTMTLNSRGKQASPRRRWALAATPSRPTTAATAVSAPAAAPSA